MPRERSALLVPVGALILACGGALSAAPPPSAPPAASASGKPAASALGAAWKGEPVGLKADKLRVDVVNRRAELEGHVELKRAELTVRCERIELHLDEHGQVLWAKGAGGVAVAGRDLSAEAGEVTFDLARQMLWLSGAVQLVRGGVKLRAEAATIDLATQHVELSGVSGSLSAP